MIPTAQEHPVAKVPRGTVPTPYPKTNYSFFFLTLIVNFYIKLNINNEYIADICNNLKVGMEPF